MITVRAGSQVHTMLVLLAMAGEFPMYSVHLIGNPRIYKRKILALAMPQTFRNPNTGEEITTKLVNVSGKAKEKTIRLYKGALPILEWIGLYETYQAQFYNHSFSGQARIKNRNHRVAEVLVACMRAGIEILPSERPRIQAEKRLRLFSEQAVFYTARQFKNLSVGEMNKIKFTRLVGALMVANETYAVYNVRDTVMKWNGCGEFKTKAALAEVARMNVSDDGVEKVIVFGESDEKVLKTVLNSEEKNGKDFRLDFIYRAVYFIPLNENGMRLFRFFLIQNWREQLQELLFDESERLDELSSLECDAYVNGVYVFSYLDLDIAKLIRFKNATLDGEMDYEIVCYPFQVKFIKEYFGKDVKVKTIELIAIEQALGVVEVK